MTMSRFFLAALPLLAACDALWGGFGTMSQATCTEEIQKCSQQRSACPTSDQAAAQSEAQRICGAPPPPPAPTCGADKVTGTSRKYATGKLLLPRSTGPMTYATDIDGNGAPENQWKAIVELVTIAGLDLQATLNSAVEKAEIVILADLVTPDLMTASCAGLTLGVAELPQMGDPLPHYDGTDTFKLGATRDIKLYGGILGGKLNTTPSRSLTAAQAQKLDFMLSLGDGDVLPLTVYGLHIEGRLGLDGGQPVIVDGQLHGALSKKDIDGKIIPAVATLVTRQINDKPMDSGTKNLIAVFENMINDVSKDKCNADMTRCCKTNPATCVILPEEVQVSPLGGTLAGDVHVFDDNGNWAPQPPGMGVVDNGLSFGLGFSAIRAAF
jgi:hypothetical protein